MERALSEEQELLLEYLREEQEVLKSYSQDPTTELDNNNDKGIPLADQSVASLNDICLDEDENEANAADMTAGSIQDGEQADDEAIIEETDMAIEWLKTSITKSQTSLESSTTKMQRSCIPETLDESEIRTPLRFTRPEDVIKEVFAELSPTTRDNVLKEYHEEIRTFGSLEEEDDEKEEKEVDKNEVEEAEVSKEERKEGEVENGGEAVTETAEKGKKREREIEQETATTEETETKTEAKEQRVVIETKDNFIRTASADDAENTLQMTAPFGTVTMNIATQINSHKTKAQAVNKAAPAFTRVKLREVDSKMKTVATTAVKGGNNAKTAPLSCIAIPPTTVHDSQMNIQEVSRAV